MSVRANIAGPFAEITVGSGSSAVVFNLPKALLCNTSTYFKAALNNGFLETATQKITLDEDDPEVFRTYAVWLFQGELKPDSLDRAGVERHLFHVYIFADSRGITCLADDVVTMVSSFWLGDYIDMDVTRECLPLLPTDCNLYQLTLDSLILESRALRWDPTKWRDLCSHSGEIVAKLFQRERALPATFKELSHCFNSICHYHDHDETDGKEECIQKMRRGCNLWDAHMYTERRIEWKR